jgi:hypothetical protein
MESILFSLSRSFNHADKVKKLSRSLGLVNRILNSVAKLKINRNVENCQIMTILIICYLQ